MRRATRVLACLVSPAGIAGATMPIPAGPKDRPPAVHPIAAKDHAERAGQGDGDAPGEMPCAQHQGQPMATCPFGVARGAPGDATVVITRPDGRKRAIVVAEGKVLSAEISQADGDVELDSRNEADLVRIRIGEARCGFPEVVVLAD